MSECEQLQSRLEAFLIARGLDRPYGVLSSVEKMGARVVRSLTFCRPRTHDGTVYIYSPTFFTVRTSRNRNTQVFRSVEEVEQHILDTYC